MAKITVNKISTDVVENYTEQDLKLIPSFDIVSQFNPETDVIEFSVYNEQNLLEGINYDYTDYTVTLDYNTKENSISSVNVDPEKDLLNFGIDQGTYTVIYNFLRNQISSSFDNPYYIKEISSDRKELRIANNNIPNDLLEKTVEDFKTELGESVYFEDFEINLDNNNIFLANNIIVDTTSDQYTVLIKLYEPLPTQFGIKDTLRVILQTAEECSYQVNFPLKEIPSPSFPSLRGPNFNLNTSDLTNNSTVYIDNQTLTKTNTSSDLFSGSLGQLKNILESKGITPNVNYQDFNNFVYFSSAEQRVRNFYYKAGKVEEYTAELTALNAVTGAEKSGSIAYYQTLINNILENFDEYEKFQYYSSGSKDIYPKTNDTFPYILESTGSVKATGWLSNSVTSGSTYDLENDDRLVNSLPNYVKDDTRNNEFFLFMDMVGQHFDDIWVYTKDLENRFDADNRLKYGISKDIVADAIRSMGVNLYQNNFSSDNLLSALIGVNPAGGTEFPTGSEVIESVVSASNDHSVLDDVNKEFYKRIFHNLPLLLKQKGSIAGLRNLINTFGIPDSILRISEFGGKDINEERDDNDYYQSTFTHAMYNSGSSTTSKFSTTFELNPKWGADANRPETFALRIKPDNLPTTDTYSLITQGGIGGVWYLTLDYTGSGLASSSYSGSIPSQSKYEAEATLWDGTNKVDSIVAPFYNGNWWLIGVRKTGDSSPYTINLLAAENINHADDGYGVGTAVLSTTTNAMTNWKLCERVDIPASSNSSVTLGGEDYYGLTGSFQEVRLYNAPIPPQTLHNLAVNPHNIGGSNPTSSANNLAFRAPLGTEVETTTNIGSGLISNHPKVTGSFATSSFSANSSYTVGADIIFIPNHDFSYYQQVPAGIKNRVKEKIQLESSSLAPHNPGLTSRNLNVLSPLRSIQQTNDLDSGSSYTNDINLLEIAFSPQNEINDDINNSFGYFNIGEYIGDPRHISESVTSYQDLDYLRDIHFRKYYKNYSWNDYVRLIKFFDNSLFKMLQDFAPAKSSLVSGVAIKQHVLERNKQRPPIVEVTQSYYTGSINSGVVEGGQGGGYDAINFITSSNEFRNGVSPGVTQSWDYAVSTLSGSLVVNQSTQDEFYNGELSGSEVVATDGELNAPIPLGSGLSAFIGNWDQGRKGLNSNLLQWQNGGYANFKVDTTTKKYQVVEFTQLSGTGTSGEAGPDFTYYFQRLVPGDTLTIKLSTTDISQIFTITGYPIQQLAPGSNSTGYRFSIEHDWVPEGAWLDYLLTGVTVGVELIYDGSPLGSNKEIRNALQNNTSNSRLSTIYQDIDYSSNAVTPINYDLLKTNSALKAPIQDSNYAQKTWRNSRYDGTRVSSVGFNLKIQR